MRDALVLIGGIGLSIGFAAVSWFAWGWCVRNIGLASGSLVYLLIGLPIQGAITGGIVMGGLALAGAAASALRKD